jgi:hypothetical protein
MYLALLAKSGLFPPFLGLRRWWTGNKPKAPSSFTTANREQYFELVSKCVASPSTNIKNFQTHRPLRVVRILESGHSVENVGRMVISGRMADVCDELDRLAARDAMVS